MTQQVLEVASHERSVGFVRVPAPAWSAAIFLLITALSTGQTVTGNGTPGHLAAFTGNGGVSTTVGDANLVGIAGPPISPYCVAAWSGLGVTTSALFSLPSLLVVQQGPGAVASFQSTSSLPVVIDNSANLGIGTATPGQVLDLFRQPQNADVLINLQNGNADWLAGIEGGVSNRFSVRTHGGSVTPFSIEYGGTSSGQNNALRIRTNGDVSVNQQLGIGTASPAVPLHIIANPATYQGDEAMLVMHKSSVTPVGSDAGLVFRLRNDINVLGPFNTAGIFDVVDATGDLHALALRVTASATSPMNTVAYFRGDGSVGIGTTTPIATLHVNGSAAKPGGGSWTYASDARLKKNVEPLDDALRRLLQLHGKTFEYIDPAQVNELSGTRIGMIAQEVETVFPDWVETGSDGFKRLTYRGFEALTVEALRELHGEHGRALAAVDGARKEAAQALQTVTQDNATMRETIHRLESSLDELSARVAEVSRQVEGGTGTKQRK